MKNSYILLAVLLMAALVSCQENELRNDEFVAKDGDIVFRMTGNGRTTKSMDSVTPVKGATIDLGIKEGTHFILEETVIDLNDIDFGPQTKGTPAYTENLGVLYADNLGVFAEGDFGNFAYENAEKEIGDDGRWLFKHHYDSDPWPENEEEEVGFYLRMPASPAGVTLGTGAYGTNDDGNATVTFTYKSPETAAATQDILFGYRSFAKKDYPKTGIPAVLYHALTGVKFAIGNSDADISANGIAITEISLSGLYDSGTCVITPADIETQGDESYDLTTWSDLSVTEGFAISSGDYGDPIDFDEDDETFPESFYAAGTAKNLNDENATQTFWLIPHDFAENDGVILTFKYSFGGKDDLEWSMPLGEILKGREIVWNAGEIRTYTIKVDEVDLKISDDVADGEPSADDPKGIIGSVKDNVQIQNTGNVNVFIRAAIVGQWRDKNGDPVFGFTDNITDLYLVESWYEDQFVNKRRTHGLFVGLAGYDEGNTYNGWVYNPNDKYYYYTSSVAPDGYTTELFESYTVSKIPEATMGGVPLSTAEMYFTLEIASQAISAIKSNGTLETDYSEAWKMADSGFIKP